MTVLIALLVVGWVAVVLLGTQAYFRGEQSKPIHERNWRSQAFEHISRSITGANIDHAERVYIHVGMDAYNSRNLPNR